MFRFHIRDMLWVTAVIGLGLVWRQENQARQRSLDVLNRSEVVADEAALVGCWEVLEMTTNGKVQDFRGKPAAQMLFFGDGWCREDDPGNPLGLDGQFKIVRPGELNIDAGTAPGVTVTTKWRYQLQSGRLWMIRSKTPGDRPSDFDAVNDPGRTLHLLRKRELGPERPVEQPQAAGTGTDI